MLQVYIPENVFFANFYLSFLFYYLSLRHCLSFSFRSVLYIEGRKFTWTLSPGLNLTFSLNIQFLDLGRLWCFSHRTQYSTSTFLAWVLTRWTFGLLDSTSLFEGNSVHCDASNRVYLMLRSEYNSGLLSLDWWISGNSVPGDQWRQSH